ncbi:MAG: hypothetical protein JRG96_16980 [Deltaproteobacteria bacterium]|nr:hypothetical protein [Deltaproteobacteria bacterium]MBW2419114.1 hypothetical protein [Deltaproteobacteria bacterium]
MSHSPLSVAASLLLVAGALAACRPAADATFHGDILDVACGSCVFEMEGVQGCPWAAEIEGRHYLIRGPIPEDHSSHAPDGICNMTRQAVIEGELRGGELLATRMELLPPQGVPEEPRFGPADLH